jgi:CRP-like cAMP-binding protein
MKGTVEIGPLETVTVLAECGLFQGLEPEELLTVADLARLHAFKPRSDVFLEGQACEGLWIVIAGQVRLYHTAADGRQQVIGFRSSSAVLELGAALDERPFTTTATVMNSATLAFLARPALLALVRRNPVIVRNVIDQLCLELRQRDISNAVAGLKDARSRVYCTLLRLAQQFGVPAGRHVRIAYRLTRRDIADMSGVTLETAIRALSDLQRQEIVRTRSQILDLVDLGRLQHAAACQECQLGCKHAAAQLFEAASLAVEPARHSLRLQPAENGFSGLNRHKRRARAAV